MSELVIGHAEPGGLAGWRDPTLSQVREWDTALLAEAAERWAGAAAGWEHSFTEVFQRIGAPWEGAAAGAAQRRAHADRMTVIGIADRLHSASRIARAGISEIAEAQRAVLRLVGAAQNAGLTVRQDFSVTTAPGQNPVLGAAGRAGAEYFAAELRNAVGALVSADAGVARRLTDATTGLGFDVFPQAGGNPVADIPLSPPGDDRPALDVVDAANRRLLDELETDYRTLPEGQIRTDRLADVAGIRAALAVPGSHLIFLDRPSDASQMIAAATAVGDPFTADRLSVSIPGVGATTRKSMAGMTREAGDLRAAAMRIGAAIGSNDSVATIAYLGYQPPLTMDSAETLTDDLATANAPGLTAFLRDLHAAAKPGHTTALFGHSYGSLMSGIALRNGAAGLVDNVVLYGSPGFEATSPAQLGLREDQFFVMTAPDDLIANPIGRLAPAHGWGADPNAVIGDHYLFTHLETGAGTVDLGNGTRWEVGAAHGHSDYPRNATQRMTGFNLAAILLDRADLAVRSEP